MDTHNRNALARQHFVSSGVQVGQVGGDILGIAQDFVSEGFIKFSAGDWQLEHFKAWIGVKLPGVSSEQMI